MKEKKVVREERNKEKLTSGDWVMAEFYSIHSLKSSRMHAVIDEFKKLMGGKVEVVQVNVERRTVGTGSDIAPEPVGESGAVGRPQYEGSDGTDSV